MTHPKNDSLSITPAQLDAAFVWLCKQRLHFPANADIWSLRAHWREEREALLALINRGDYRFSPLQKIRKSNGQWLHLWVAQDALVLKVLAVVLQSALRLSEHCTHVKGHGGLKQTVATVQKQIQDYRFVCKTDVQDYYQSIDQFLLLNQIADQIPDRILRHYCYQVVRRTVEYGGTFESVDTGISRGCPLSPLFAALYLRGLDDKLSRCGVFYVRYMDDILILTQTRWQLRRAIKCLNQEFNALKIKKHPAKTQLGRIAKGFDFLGYRFGGETLHLADKTVRKHVERLLRLYEQQVNKKATPIEVARVLGDYVKRWRRWCSAGLSTITTVSWTYGVTVPGWLDPGP